jgi:hypothetical protein
MPASTEGQRDNDKQSSHLFSSYHCCFVNLYQDPCEGLRFRSAVTFDCAVSQPIYCWLAVWVIKDVDTWNGNQVSRVMSACAS